MSARQSKRAAFSAKQRRLRELRRTYGARRAVGGHFIAEPRHIEVTQLTDSVRRYVVGWM